MSWSIESCSGIEPGERRRQAEAWAARLSLVCIGVLAIARLLTWSAVRGDYLPSYFSVQLQELLSVCLLFYASYLRDERLHRYRNRSLITGVERDGATLAAAPDLRAPAASRVPGGNSP
jgi:hypothetical protein